MSRRPEAKTERRRARRKRSRRPRFWIVAGPNGSGKSSAYEDSEIEEFGGSVWIINPDALARRIADIEGLANANLAAVQRIETWLEASIKAHQTIGVETVLSTSKYRRLVRLAKSLKFEDRLIYVILSSPDLNVERVKLRVAKGGHNVEADKIRSRYGRSLRQLPWFLDRADHAWLYDNSGTSPKLIGEKIGGVLTLDPDALPAIKKAARKVSHR